MKQRDERDVVGTEITRAVARQNRGGLVTQVAEVRPNRSAWMLHVETEPHGRMGRTSDRSPRETQDNEAGKEGFAHHVGLTAISSKPAGSPRSFSIRTRRNRAVIGVKAMLCS